MSRAGRRGSRKDAANARWVAMPRRAAHRWMYAPTVVGRSHGGGAPGFGVREGAHKVDRLGYISYWTILVIMNPVGRLAADLWTAPPNTASTAAREDIWQPLCIWHVGQQCQHPVASNFLEASNVSRDQCQESQKGAQKFGLKKQSQTEKTGKQFPQTHQLTGFFCVPSGSRTSWRSP